MPGIDKFFTAGRVGNPGFGALWPFFASHLQNAPTGYARFYPLSDGKWYEKRGSTAKAFAFASDIVTDHGALGGLTDDDHVGYLLKSGLREWDEQGGDPSTPASTKWKLYFKAGGLYYIDDTGAVIGPLTAGGFTSPLTTRGDILTRDGSTHIRRPLGAARTVLRSDGTDALFANPKDGDMDAGADEFVSTDPLIGTSTTTQVFPYSAISSGAGATTTYLKEAGGHIGVVQIETGSATNGRTAFLAQANVALFGTKELWTSFYFNIPGLADGTDDYELWAGFLDNTGSGDPVDGACVHYDRDTSTDWQRMTADNSTITQNPSGTTDGTAVAVASGWQTILVRATSSLVEFWHKADGGNWVFLGSESTNIPSGAGRVLTVGIKIEKEAGSASKLIDIDTIKIGGR